MIGIADYGTSNLGSLTNALVSQGIDYLVSGDPSELRRCDRLVLPGVGAFGHAMERLREQQLDTFLIGWAASSRPIFGICLGMQLLMDNSTELGHFAGLGIVPGDVVPIRGGRRKVHTGWNHVKPAPRKSFLTTSGHVYFVHSYQCQPAEPGTVAGFCSYGGTVVAALQQNNIWGVQFHPEKSGEFGLSILKSFAHAPF